MSGSAAQGGPSGSSTGAVALAGLGGSLEDKDCELLCPVCFELLEEAYVSRCGHSFCFTCIAKSVELHRRCPKCGASLPTRDHIFPNFLLNELVSRRRALAPGGGGGGGPLSRGPLLPAVCRLPLREVRALRAALAARERALTTSAKRRARQTTQDFLKRLLRSRELQLRQLRREIQLVRRDLEKVAADTDEGADEDADEYDTAEEASEERFARSTTEVAARAEDAIEQHFDDFVQCYFAHRADELYFPLDDPSPPGTPTHSAGGTDISGAIGSNIPAGNSTPGTSGTVGNLGAIGKISGVAGNAPLPSAAGPSGSHVTPDLPNEESRVPQGPSRPQSAAEHIGRVDMSCTRNERGLDAFKEDLMAFTRYRSLRPIATLSYCSDAINYSTIVSTIEFDKDDELFAIAGVTKRIKVFEWESVVRDAVDMHYPVAEMQCAHKISCVSWNAYHKQMLACADYEGGVCIWDVSAGRVTRALHEHDKRAWSVDWSAADPRLMASGSDDSRVKLWSHTQDRSLATLEARFNVCCVRFSPTSAAHLAFGSADHCVHYYDLRAPRHPLLVLKDHRKAVSYVQFLDPHTLVSASTDSQLKLWRVDSSQCLRSFTGHANEKNFVGLATDGTYIACGSENNALYVYYKGLSKPLLSHKFEGVRGFLERGGAGGAREEDAPEFVSAVCWRRSDDRPAILAANSQGTIKVLEMV